MAEELIDGKYTQKDYDFMSENVFNDEKNPVVEIVRIKPGQEITIEDLM